MVAAKTGHFQGVGDDAAGLLGQVLQVAVHIVVGHEHGTLGGQQVFGALLEGLSLAGRERCRHLGPGLGGAGGALGVLAGEIEQYLIHGADSRQGSAKGGRQTCSKKRLGGMPTVRVTIAEKALALA